MNSDDWLAQMRAEEKQRRDRLPAVKAILCDALKAEGIAKVIIEYDGEGDSGQVACITALDANEQAVKLDRRVTLALHKPDEPTNYDTFHEALDDFAWTALEAYHSGFEINDGGFGTITIDAVTGTVTIDHNDRITDVDNTVTEV